MTRLQTPFPGDSMKFAPLLTIGFFSLLSVMGCAHKEEAKTEAPAMAAATPMPTDTPVTEAAVPATKRAHYVVRPGDSLWKISAKAGVLGDAFYWPILYKQNRDQIEDPDLIQVSQDLDYGKTVDDADSAEAVREAKETPPYVPHSTARKPLPLKY
jgi:hypothetical protein